MSSDELASVLTKSVFFHSVIVSTFAMSLEMGCGVEKKFGSFSVSLQLKAYEWWNGFPECGFDLN